MREKWVADRLLPAFPACSLCASVEKPYSRLYTFIKGSFSWQNSDDQGSFSVVDQRRSGQFFRAKSENLRVLFHGKKMKQGIDHEAERSV